MVNGKRAREILRLEVCYRFAGWNVRGTSGVASRTGWVAAAWWLGAGWMPAFRSPDAALPAFPGAAEAAGEILPERSQFRPPVDGFLGAVRREGLERPLTHL